MFDYEKLKSLIADVKRSTCDVEKTEVELDIAVNASFPRRVNVSVTRLNKTFSSEEVFSVLELAKETLGDKEGFEFFFETTYCVTNSGRVYCINFGLTEKGTIKCFTTQNSTILSFPSKH